MVECEAELQRLDVREAKVTPSNTTVDEILKKIAAAPGVFTRSLDQVEKHVLKLHRQPWFGSSLAGNACQKTIKQRDVRTRAMDAIEVVDARGNALWAGDSEWLQKFVIFGNKLASLVELTTANRPLCKHEIKLSEAMAVDLGMFFGPNFPQCSISYKPHVTFFHIHEFNKVNASIGKTTVCSVLAFT